MAFIPIREDCGYTDNMKMQASTTILKNQAQVFASGYLVPATNASTEVKYVSLEAKTTAGGETPEILTIATNEEMEFLADTSTNTSQANVGTKCDLADGLTINVGATTNKVFFVKKVVGAPANRKVIGYFVSKDS